MKPTLGRIVIYRSKTGDYDCPAIVTATAETIDPEAAERGSMPSLDSDEHVHLTVFTAGLPGHGGPPPPSSLRHTGGGSYQEHNVPHEEGSLTSPGFLPQPGSWRWPERV